MCPTYASGDVTLHAAPISHGSGLYAVPNVAKAAAHVIPTANSFDPQLVLQAIEQYRDRDSKDLFIEAFTEMCASVDRGLDPGDIEALYFGNFTNDFFVHQSH